MKKFFRPLATAWTSIGTHKLRSFLTILGVVIGVGAVIVLMSIGKGTESTILSNLSGLGTNLVTVSPGAATTGGVRGDVGSSNSLTLEDAQAIADNVGNILAVAPTTAAAQQVIANGQNMFVRVSGVTPDYQQVYNLTVTEGSFITQSQYDANQKVAVIGPTVAETLFPGDDPVGQTVRSGNNIFTITGLLEAQGSGFNSTDNMILTPLSTLQSLVARTKTTTGQHIVSSIVLLASDKDMVNTVMQDVTLFLENRHQIPIGSSDDFTVSSMQSLLANVSASMNQVTLLLGAIAGISLLVGGIGVMNIMLVSVMERRREIGIRKALGAKERDIWGQFLLDSAVLTLTGGLIGVGVGWGVSYLVEYLGFQTTLVTTDIVVLAVGVSVAIGLFFGFYPAWQGSRLDPIQALRSE
jgi:putative ABC transport system permease protein